MLTPYLPYPLYSGGQIRSYNLLKNLSKKHQIVLFSFIRDKSEEKYITDLKKYCIDVKVFLKRPPWSLKSLFLAGVSVYPLVVCMYLKKQLRDEIEYITNKQHFDLIHAETFYVMPNIPPNNIPTILAEQTIEYMVYQHYTEKVKFAPLKLLMDLDVHKIRYWEKKYWHKATRVVAMSEADKNVMQQLIPNLDVNLVPNGVDLDFFPEKKTSSSYSNINKTVLFVGNFKWLQNREAVSIMVKEIWPKIINKLPKAKLWIVGKYPTKDIIKFASDSIKISSDIKDIRGVYSSSDVLLAPIYGPGGTRYKILESMATGLPVVTTPTGIEGIGARDEVDVLISDDYDDLACKTVKLLTDNIMYQRLSKNSRNLVKRKFNWSIIANTIDRIYEEAAYGNK